MEAMKQAAIKAYVVVQIMRSMSNPDKFYEIRFSHKDQLHYCTCPAWKFQSVKKDQPRTCKHLKAMGFELHQLVGTKQQVGASAV
jgi:hypothetical protein